MIVGSPGPDRSTDLRADVYSLSSNTNVTRRLVCCRRGHDAVAWNDGRKRGFGSVGMSLCRVRVVVTQCSSLITQINLIDPLIIVVRRSLSAPPAGRSLFVSARRVRGFPYIRSSVVH